MRSTHLKSGSSQAWIIFILVMLGLICGTVWSAMSWWSNEKDIDDYLESIYWDESREATEAEWVAVQKPESQETYLDLIKTRHRYGSMMFLWPGLLNILAALAFAPAGEWAAYPFLMVGGCLIVCFFAAL